MVTTVALNQDGCRICVGFQYRSLREQQFRLHKHCKTSESCCAGAFLSDFTLQAVSCCINTEYWFVHLYDENIYFMVKRGDPLLVGGTLGSCPICSRFCPSLLRGQPPSVTLLLCTALPWAFLLCCLLARNRITQLL